MRLIRSRRIGGTSSIDPAGGRSIDGLRLARRGSAARNSGKVCSPGSEEDRVGVRRRFGRQRGHVQAAEDDEDAARAIAVRDPVRPVRVRDVDLDHDEVRRVVRGQALDVLVDDHRLVVRPQVGGERRQAERREQRVLDRPPVRARRLGQGGQDELDAERALARHALHCKVKLGNVKPVRLGKRVFDVCGAVGGLLFFGPLMLCVAAAILLDDGRPVLFRQARLGRGRRTFDDREVPIDARRVGHARRPGPARHRPGRAAAVPEYPARRSQRRGAAAGDRAEMRSASAGPGRPPPRAGA